MPRRQQRPTKERDLNDYWFDTPEARRLWSRRRVYQDGLKMLLGPDLKPGVRRMLLELHCLGGTFMASDVKRIMKSYEAVLTSFETQGYIVRAGHKNGRVIYRLSPWARLALLEFVRECEYFIWRTGGRLRLQSDDPILRPAPPWLAQAAGGIYTPVEPATTVARRSASADQ